MFMKKIFSIQLVAMAFALLTGCSGNTKQDPNKNDSGTPNIYLVHFLTDNGFLYYYDRETKIIYCQSVWKYSNVFTLLDRDGKPRIYEPNKY